MAIKPTNRFILAMIPLLLLGVIVFSSCFGGCHKPTVTTLPPTPASPAEVTVYFTKSKGSNTVTEGVVRPLPRPVASASNHDATRIRRLHYAIESLLAGPTNDESLQGFYSEIPKGTQLLGIEEKDGQLHVNLSRQFTSGGGSNSIKQRVAELTQTIISSGNGKQPVLVDVEGQKLEIAGGEGLELDQPVTGNPR